MTGTLSGPATFTIDPAAVGDDTGLVVIKGNLQVDGTTTTINSTTLTVDDKNIELATVASPTDLTADGAGITIKGATDKTLNWVDATDAWTSSEHLNLLTGKAYYINGTSVLTATTLGSGVTASSLTSVGTLSGLTVTGYISATNTSNTTVASAGFDASTSWGLKIANASTTAGTGAGIYFLGGTNSESYIGNLYESSGVGALSFQTRVSGTRAERMRIDSSGNLLVGGSATRSSTAGTALLNLFNGTAPVGTLTSGVSLYSASGDFNFMDATGGGYKVGFRNVPASGTRTSSYTLATSDVGKYVQVGTSGAITIPNSTFAEGDIVSVFNNTGGNNTITCSISTAYIGGTDADKDSVTLATRGVATIMFISSTVCVITGNVT